jgi:hypothetical protein
VSCSRPELLFGLAFAVLLVLGGLAYLIGSVGERVLEFAEVRLSDYRDSAHRVFGKLEGISRKPFSL